jgi:hypothetical protein
MDRKNVPGPPLFLAGQGVGESLKKIAKRRERITGGSRFYIAEAATPPPDLRLAIVSLSPPHPLSR